MQDKKLQHGQEYEFVFDDAIDFVSQEVQKQHLKRPKAKTDGSESESSGDEVRHLFVTCC